MIKLGERQQLIVSTKSDFGLYLSENEESALEVLLPNKYVEEGMSIGDSV
ncbi:MAG: RNA-binding protein, partial [Clostridia bacterium]|nr:RNA-binding protein [Clostridia bacterium]